MAQQTRPEYTEALKLVLHGQRVGILVHYSGGRNMLTFDPERSGDQKWLSPHFSLQ